jgi:hypothetical protein
MTIGDQLIAELGRRGARGGFFDYKTYRRLHAVDSSDELQSFLDDQCCRFAHAGMEVKQLAQALLEEPSRRTLASPWRSLKMLLFHTQFWLLLKYVFQWGGKPTSWVAMLILFGCWPSVWALVGALVGWHWDWPVSGFIAGWLLPVMVAVAIAWTVRLSGRASVS